MSFRRLISDEELNKFPKEFKEHLNEYEKQHTPTGLCQKCGIHKATEKFAYDSLALTHGGIQWLCKCCVLKIQIEYRKNNPMPTLEELERELANLNCT
jgi:hypothetical protein